MQVVNMTNQIKFKLKTFLLIIIIFSYFIALSRSLAKTPATQDIYALKDLLGAKEGDYTSSKSIVGNCNEITLSWLTNKNGVMLILGANNIFRHINQGEISETDNNKNTGESAKCKTIFNTQLKQNELSQTQTTDCLDKIQFKRERIIKIKQDKLYYQVMITDFSDSAKAVNSVECEYRFKN